MRSKDTGNTKIGFSTHFKWKKKWNVRRRLLIQCEVTSPILFIHCIGNHVNRVCRVLWLPIGGRGSASNGSAVVMAAASRHCSSDGPTITPTFDRPKNGDDISTMTSEALLFSVSPSAPDEWSLPPLHGQRDAVLQRKTDRQEARQQGQHRLKMSTSDDGTANQYQCAANRLRLG